MRPSPSADSEPIFAIVRCKFAVVEIHFSSRQESLATFVNRSRRFPNIPPPLELSKFPYSVPSQFSYSSFLSFLYLHHFVCTKNIVAIEVRKQYKKKHEKIISDDLNHDLTVNK